MCAKVRTCHGNKYFKKLCVLPSQLGSKPDEHRHRQQPEFSAAIPQHTMEEDNNGGYHHFLVAFIFLYQSTLIIGKCIYI